MQQQLSGTILSEIKSKVNIYDIASGKLSLKKSGRNYKANCPFHKENTPSFFILPDINRYHCFGCGKTGDIIDLVQELEGLDWFSAIQYLASRAGIEIDTKPENKETLLLKKVYEINGLAAKYFT